ncbi:MAG: hypothetical protein K8I03_12685 [Ignavibacteria bacterium]|nr:hypothetical protein [Ignavibacteria bacterium]
MVLLLRSKLLIIVQINLVIVLECAFLEILESLTRDELKSFRRFLLSPYFNRSEKVVKLYDNIIKFYPNFDNPKLSKEFLHKKIGTGLAYNEITMRRLLFDLQKLSEKFMAQTHFERKTADAGIFLIEELAGRGSSKMFDRNMKETSRLLDSMQYIDSDLCLNRFRLKTDDFYFGMIKDKITKKNFVTTEASKLISGITYLISFFMLEAIKHNDTLLTYSRTFNIKYNEKFINQFIKLFDFQRLEIFMRANKMIGSHIIEVYLNTLKAFLYFDNDFYYKQLRNSLYKYQESLSLTDNHFLFGRLAGYCITKNMNSAKQDTYYDSELFSIYKIIVEKKYFETEANKYVPVDLYRNILIQSAKMNELGWMEQFIQDYSRLLHPNRKKEIISYSYALLNFERRAYDESLKYLSKINTEEFSYHLDIRNMYFKIYYETENYEAALSAAFAHKKYVKENLMLSDSRRQAQENFTRAAIKLVNYHNSRTKTDLTSLRLQIQKSKNIENRGWLLCKISSLDKSLRRAI